MELGFVEGLRRRWDILGIDVEAQAKGKEKAKEMPLDLEESENQMQVDEDDQDATRRAIMDGAIVKSVISSAAKCESSAWFPSVPCPRVKPDGVLLFLLKLIYHRDSTTQDKTIHKLANLDNNLSLAAKPTRIAGILSP